MPELTGGEAVVRMLELHGLEFAFGMAGYQPLPYYDALARQRSIRHILIRDEKHGAFMADGYARIRNRPAVADATLGPGATNLISGLAESFGASIPMIALTGEVNSLISGRAATQESDQFGMIKPTVKMTVPIDRIERVPELVRRAFAVANGGRPGPVHLNVREDVMHGRFDFQESDLYATPEATGAAMRPVRPDAPAIERAAALLRRARRPVMLVGGGIHLSEGWSEVQRLAELTGMPVATTMSGKGALAETHPLSVGVFGRYSRFGNDLIKAADVLLVVGCKLGEISTSRWTLLPEGAAIIQIDIDPTELGKVYQTQVGIWADARLALAGLAEALESDRHAMAPRAREQATEIAGRRAAWEQEAAANYGSDERPIHNARLLRDLRSVLPDDAIVVADGGFAAHWSGLLFETRMPGRSYIANRGHAAIGYGLSGAIGAKLAAPGRVVVALCGDNGFAMALAEMETSRRIGAPVVCVVIDNQALGYVKALQHGLYDGRFISVDFLDVDYGAVARNFGCFGARVDDPAHLGPVLRDAIESGETAVIDVMVTTDASRMLPGIDARAVSKEPAGR
ncbi:MAG: thiamine pyrophosphate-binding protein [Dehalococcoidia bacterium]|nr:thiamine pyrophosphate-binding protein [Dehalococcoidia bacterium]